MTSNIWNFLCFLVVIWLFCYPCTSCDFLDGLIMSFYYALLVISIFLFWFLFFFQTEALKQTNSLALFLLSLAIWPIYRLCKTSHLFILVGYNLFLANSFFKDFVGSLLQYCYCRMLSSNNLTGNLPMTFAMLGSLTDLWEFIIYASLLT
jgi:hypothetical protein